MAESNKEIFFMRSEKAQTAAQRVNAALMSEGLSIIESQIVLSMVSSALKDAGSRILEKTSLSDAFKEAVEGKL